LWRRRKVTAEQLGLNISEAEDPDLKFKKTSFRYDPLEKHLQTLVKKMAAWLFTNN
jgi:hypothetical protein